MKIGVSLKILQEAIEQQRLFQGQKGHYLDATVFIDISPADQYGNHGMITQDVTKEEKDSGVKGPILGNCKVFWCDDSSVSLGGNTAPQAAPAPQQAPPPPQQAPAPQAPPQAGKTNEQMLVEFQSAPNQQEAEKIWAGMSVMQQDYICQALA